MHRLSERPGALETEAAKAVLDLSEAIQEQSYYAENFMVETSVTKALARAYVVLKQAANYYHGAENVALFWNGALPDHKFKSKGTK